MYNIFSLTLTDGTVVNMYRLRTAMDFFHGWIVCVERIRNFFDR
jgi:hypothetical protein